MNKNYRTNRIGFKSDTNRQFLIRENIINKYRFNKKINRKINNEMDKGYLTSLYNMVDSYTTTHLTPISVPKAPIIKSDNDDINIGEDIFCALELDDNYITGFKCKLKVFKCLVKKYNYHEINVDNYIEFKGYTIHKSFKPFINLVQNSHNFFRFPTNKENPFLIPYLNKPSNLNDMIEYYNGNREYFNEKINDKSNFSYLKISKFLSEIRYPNNEKNINNVKNVILSRLGKIKFETVSGEDIYLKYKELRNHDINSCMTGLSIDKFRLYTENPNNVKLLLAYVGDDNNKGYLGRVLVWEGIFYDRIYTKNGNASIFDKYFRYNNLIPINITKLVMKLKIPSNLPYLDSTKKSKNRIVSNHTEKYEISKIKRRVRIEKIKSILKLNN